MITDGSTNAARSTQFIKNHQYPAFKTANVYSPAKTPPNVPKVVICTLLSHANQDAKLGLFKKHCLAGIFHSNILSPKRFDFHNWIKYTQKGYYVPKDSLKKIPTEWDVVGHLIMSGSILVIIRPL